jgi:pimeloyl-ACP methyl ester carboxylesterase
MNYHALLMPDLPTSNHARDYVLVHGAWHGAWCWRRVVDRLQQAGQRVLTPTLTGLGDRVHLARPDTTIELFAEDIINAMDAEEVSGAILVGHSFAGRPISLVADRIPHRLQHLVYLDAGLPDNGVSHLDAMTPALQEARIKAANAFDGGMSLPPPPPEDLGVTDPGDAAWLQRRLVPHPFSSFRSAIQLTHALGNGLPVTYIRCTSPVYQPMEASARRARGMEGWRYVELAAGHDAMVTSPQELADILLAIPPTGV